MDSLIRFDPATGTLLGVPELPPIPELIAFARGTGLRFRRKIILDRERSCGCLVGMALALRNPAAVASLPAGQISTTFAALVALGLGPGSVLGAGRPGTRIGYAVAAAFDGMSEAELAARISENWPPDLIESTAYGLAAARAVTEAGLWHAAPAVAF